MVHIYEIIIGHFCIVKRHFYVIKNIILEPKVDFMLYEPCHFRTFPSWQDVFQVR